MPRRPTACSRSAAVTTSPGDARPRSTSQPAPVGPGQLLGALLDVHRVDELSDVLRSPGASCCLSSPSIVVGR